MLNSTVQKTQRVTKNNTTTTTKKIVKYFGKCQCYFWLEKLNFNLHIKQTNKKKKKKKNNILFDCIESRLV